MKKLVIFVAVVALLAVAWWVSRNRINDVAQKRVAIHQAAKTLLYLPLYVAIDQGLAQAQGIQFDVVTAGGDSPAFAALISGRAQFAQGDPTFVAISHERGGPGVVIGTVLDRVAFWGVTFDDSIQPFSDPSGFRGRTVVTFPEPNTSFVVQKSLLQKARLTLGRDSKIQQAAFGTELAPLETKTADIAMSIEPNVSQAVARGARVVYSYADSWGPFLLTGLMTTEDVIRRDPDLVRRVVLSFDQALRLIRGERIRALVTAQKYFPEVSPEVIEAAVRRMVDARVFPEHSTVNQASWTAALALRVQVGDLRTVDHAREVDNSFAQQSLSTH